MVATAIPTGGLSGAGGRPPGRTGANQLSASPARTTDGRPSAAVKRSAGVAGTTAEPNTEAGPVSRAATRPAISAL